MPPDDTTNSTTPAAAAIAETRERGHRAKPPSDASEAQPGENVDYTIDPAATRAIEVRPYERKAADPLYRPLRIYALDPALPRLEGWIATVNVPFEPLEPGFIGRVFEIDARDGGNGQQYRHLDLDDRTVLLNDGRNPSPSDPLFHQQMVYAVCSLVYASFKTALGRDLAWGFVQGPRVTRAQLLLRPYAMLENNAYYDEQNGELAFGYFKAEGTVYGRNLPKGLVFTSLSHDIIAHELTHALLDGLRARFMLATGPDVLAFHEGFADLVAIFQHFSYEKVVHSALARARGKLEDAINLTSVAQQFGQTVGEHQALRSAIDSDPAKPKRYDPALEEHQLGSVLVSAVFDAFLTIFRRKTARYIRLATGGTGVLPHGELASDLQTILAAKASRLAAQFQAICIRAIDYGPPVDVELGEFLRAVITADHDLVPDDEKWAYREAWVDAFRARGIYPRDVAFLSEDALLWRAPAKMVPPVQDLTFAELKFEGDPGRPANARELRRQAGGLGRLVTRWENLDVFGLAPAGHARLHGDDIALPCVHSIRSSRRVGPDGQVVFDLIAEVTQTRKVRGANNMAAFEFIGGSTIVIGPDGAVRYVVSKSILNEERLNRQREFQSSKRGKKLWKLTNGVLQPRARPLRALHKHR